MDKNYITIREYLDKKGIKYKQIGGELTTHCLFNSCDNDSQGNEAHLYFSEATGQYQCKKCSESGNIVTLSKHLGDPESEILPVQSPKAPKVPRVSISNELVTKCHQALPELIRKYLNDRGITDDIISEHKLGWGNFYQSFWITIPVYDGDGQLLFLKLRKDPNDAANEDKYKVFPAKGGSSIFGWDMLKGNGDMVVVCEGEFDCLILRKYGIPAITSTAGAGTFKREWAEQLSAAKKIYVCFDKDEAGRKGEDRLVKMLEEVCQKSKVFLTHLPERVPEDSDITDYFIKLQGNPEELINQCSVQVAGKKDVDISKFKELTSDDLIKILGLTIKKDEENKLIAFLCQLSAYTEDSQFNVSFNAPSSTGKSFIPIEISSLFPSIDLLRLGNCSPTAFFHEQGEYDKEKNQILVNLSRKIIIFLDQPSNALLERLRSLLSHDQKEMQAKITDKSQKGGNRTKTVIIRGFPAVTFCSAGLKIDEQEGTRFLLLSPETSQEKMRESILERIKRQTDQESYRQWLDNNPERRLLKERIEAIKYEQIDDIKIPDVDMVREAFLTTRPILKPRHQRDIGRLISIIKIFALLNVWFRERQGNTIIANQNDVDEAMEVWEKISESQEYNLPPYVFSLYKDIIVSAWKKKNKDNSGEKVGISRKEIRQMYFLVYGRQLDDWQLRNHILPMLESAGLIYEESHPTDKRIKLVIPTLLEDESIIEIDQITQ